MDPGVGDGCNPTTAAWGSSSQPKSLWKCWVRDMDVHREGETTGTSSGEGVVSPHVEFEPESCLFFSPSDEQGRNCPRPGLNPGFHLALEVFCYGKEESRSLWKLTRELLRGLGVSLNNGCFPALCHLNPKALGAPLAVLPGWLG